MLLVDRLGRKALLTFDTSGIIVALILVGALFSQTEHRSMNVQDTIDWKEAADGSLNTSFNA